MAVVVASSHRGGLRHRNGHRLVADKDAAMTQVQLLPIPWLEIGIVFGAMVMGACIAIAYLKSTKGGDPPRSD